MRVSISSDPTAKNVSETLTHSGFYDFQIFRFLLICIGRFIFGFLTIARYTGCALCLSLLSGFGCRLVPARSRMLQPWLARAHLRLPDGSTPGDCWERAREAAGSARIPGVFHKKRKVSDESLDFWGVVWGRYSRSGAV